MEVLKDTYKHDAYLLLGSIWSMTVTPDSRYLITGAYPSSMKIFDLHTKEEIYNFKNPHGGKISLILRVLIL